MSKITDKLTDDIIELILDDMDCHHEVDHEEDGVHMSVEYSLNDEAKIRDKIKTLIQKPEDYEQNLADCTEAIDILIEQHEELCDEVVELRELQKPQVTEEWIEEKARAMYQTSIIFPHNTPKTIVYKCKKFIRLLVEEITGE